MSKDKLPDPYTTSQFETQFSEAEWGWPMRFLNINDENMWVDVIMHLECDG